MFNPTIMNKTQTGASVSLNRHRIDTSNRHGVEGAREIISVIKKRRSITVLNLPHNELGPEGCEALFSFLTSGDGKKHPIEEMVLTSNKLGNFGLRKVVAYLRGNTHLKKLLLQNNHFQRDITLFEDFADAINSSVLDTLYIGTNNGLGDTFSHVFLPRLNAPFLRELNMSSTRLSAESLGDITDFLTSVDRCRLHTFGCSANSLGTAGVREIIEAIEKVNYRLRKLDLFSNAANDEAIDTEESKNQWRQTYNLLTKFLNRNGTFTRNTERQALQLLRYARPALLHHASPAISNSSTSSPCQDCSCGALVEPASSSSSSIPPDPTSTPSPVFPLELKHHVLSFFAPSLSPAQRIRIFHYASSPKTLPPLIPTLYKACDSSTREVQQQKPCVPDPAAFGISGSVDGCPPGKCMGSHGSLFCHRVDDRTRWLEVVGCDVYDPGSITA